jgi:acyl-CoA dehydrogenase
MCKRLSERVAFGTRISEQSVWYERIANARINIELNRLLTLKAAYMADTVGNKAARAEIAMIKVAGPNTAQKVFDDAIQAFGGAGVTDDADLADQAAWMRALRILDGPDEVHRNQIAKIELKKQAASA